ncbi:unnamed protein product [Schistosoma rodhaini]|uniref:Uncharacterized protein n=1 Tax=Schistosoma rodhaini TaxID=6188 RepID=A0AA85GHD8_9TREM|nr:unnamed protein product [Schistosoma rodhaini]
MLTFVKIKCFFRSICAEYFQLLNGTRIMYVQPFLSSTSDVLASIRVDRKKSKAEPTKMQYQSMELLTLAMYRISGLGPCDDNHDRWLKTLVHNQSHWRRCTYSSLSFESRDSKLFHKFIHYILYI